jgi:hypothetical protein
MNGTENVSEVMVNAATEAGSFTAKDGVIIGAVIGGTALVSAVCYEKLVKPICAKIKKSIRHKWSAKVDCDDNTEPDIDVIEEDEEVEK